MRHAQIVELFQAAIAKVEAVLAATQPLVAGEVLPSQNGAGSVLTFTFSQPMHRVVIEAVGSGTARADPFGGTPSSSAGVPLTAQSKTFDVTATTVRVYAPALVAVHVWGMRRA